VNYNPLNMTFANEDIHKDEENALVQKFLTRVSQAIKLSSQASY
jgi:hypothetical protein